MTRRGVFAFSCVWGGGFEKLKNELGFARIGGSKGAYE
jgi:hypothetical protein